METEIYKNKYSKAQYDILLKIQKICNNKDRS